MSTRAAAITVAALVVAALAYSLYLFPSLPAIVPIHWDINGNADGFAPKTTAVVMMAGMMALLGAFLMALPWLSPRSYKIEPFRDTYNYVTVVITGMLLAVHVISLQAALHPRADLGRLLISVVFLGLALVGNVIGKTRRNFWMGWRTPWTLASDTVWEATHRLAARLMFATGILGAIAIWMGVAMPVIFVVFLIAMLAPMVYSLVLYKRLEREGQLPDTNGSST